jgi:hypothetical protein
LANVGDTAVSTLLNPEATQTIDWQAEQLRCTGFLVPLYDVSAQDIFRLVTQTDPVQLVENRQQALQTASGPFGPGKLDVVKLPGRVDILFLGREDNATDPGINTLGLWAEMSDLFDNGVRAWLRLRPQLQRIALGAVCVAGVSDRVSGYKLLNRLLPRVDIDVEHSSDLFYQINRPRLATFGDSFPCKINRVSKWSTAALVLHTFTVSAKELRPGAMNIPAAIRHYSRVELDLSTDAELVALPDEHLESIWMKLLNFATEMLSKGDVP